MNALNSLTGVKPQVPKRRTSKFCLESKLRCNSAYPP